MRGGAARAEAARPGPLGLLRLPLYGAKVEHRLPSSSPSSGPQISQIFSSVHGIFSSSFACWDSFVLLLFVFLSLIIFMRKKRGGRCETVLEIKSQESYLYLDIKILWNYIFWSFLFFSFLIAVKYDSYDS